MVKNRYFTKEELKEVLDQSMKLFVHGYFTGVNFIHSEDPLPKETIIVHFLHNSKEHIKEIKDKLKAKALVLPRNAFYFLDPKYFEKLTFDEDYKNSTFFDEDLSEISIELAKRKREGISVANKELDLFIPLNAQSLDETIELIKREDAESPVKWEDPVIIVKSATKIKTIPGFVNNKDYVSLERDCEEIYTILPDKKRSQALKKYYKKLCKEKPKIGELDLNSLVFNVSQVNREFLDYILGQIKPLKTLE